MEANRDDQPSAYRAPGTLRLAARAAAAVLLTATALTLPATAPAAAHTTGGDHTLRFATFNASLNRAAAGELRADLSTPDNPQAKVIAEIIQRTRPDVVLVNEFDFDDTGAAAHLFADNYLNVPQGDAEAIDYPYHFTAPSNTGIPSGHDLNNDGTVGGADDALGFGEFPGQYGMVVYSRHPIRTGDVRTFQNFRWADMPDARLPDDPSTPQPADWFTPEELEVVRLSSKSHWDVPVEVGDQVVHVLASHPTPPTFDGEEDRNGRRNADEIRFWADYVRPERSGYITDDHGRSGGLDGDDRFVIMGDLNSDPNDGDSLPGAAQQLLDLSEINTSVTPTSDGAVEQAELQAGANTTHESEPRFDTADFADDPAPGNLRADYVLPSKDLDITDAGVFWPRSDDPLFRLVGTFPSPSSDHRLVWVDADLH